MIDSGVMMRMDLLLCFRCNSVHCIVNPCRGTVAVELLAAQHGVAGPPKMSTKPGEGHGVAQQQHRTTHFYPTPA